MNKKKTIFVVGGVAVFLGVWLLFHIHGTVAENIVNYPAKEMLNVANSLRVVLYNGRLQDMDQERLFDFAHSELYGHRKYREAIHVLDTIIAHTDQNAEYRDDAFYYLGRAHYKLSYEYKKRRERRGRAITGDNTNEYVKAFENLVNQYPDSEYIRSGKVRELLLDIIKTEKICCFGYMMRLERVLSKAYSSESAWFQDLLIQRAKEGAFVAASHTVEVDCSGKFADDDLCEKELKQKIQEEGTSNFLRTDVMDYFFDGQLRLSDDQVMDLVQYAKEKCLITNYCGPFSSVNENGYKIANMSALISIDISLEDILRITALDLFDQENSQFIRKS